MSDLTLIGADALLAAVHAHADRTLMIGPKPVARVISSLGVDAEEFQAMAQVVSESRLPRPDGVDHYPAGFVDGFVIGVRAVRAATSGDSDDE